MSYPCCICGKVGLYHVSNRNYCGEHKAEAWADRKKTCDIYDQRRIVRVGPNHTDVLLKRVWTASRERSKK